MKGPLNFRSMLGGMTLAAMVALLGILLYRNQYELVQALALAGIYIEMCNQRLLKTFREKIVRNEVRKTLS